MLLRFGLYCALFNGFRNPKKWFRAKILSAKNGEKRRGPRRFPSYAPHSKGGGVFRVV
jgi:hypothetical protein